MMSTANLLRAGLLAGALVMTAACGGTPAQPGQTPARPGQTPAQPGQTPGQPAQTPAGQPGAGGHDLQDPCGLATVEEVSNALGTEVTVAEENVGGDTTYCTYRDPSGRSVVATSFSRGETSQAVFRSFAGSEDAVPVPGLGDQAVVSGGVLFVLVGQSVVGIQPSVHVLEDLDEQQVIAVLTTLGQAVAGNL